MEARKLRNLVEKFASPRSGIVDLSSLPKDFSFARLLSPIPKTQHQVIYYDFQPLDSAHLVLLAFNEECRIIQRGCYYYLPLRQAKLNGHPCDLVFVDELWGSKSCTTWDNMNWAERLELCDAMMKLKSGEDVIPICVRVLKDVNKQHIEKTAFPHAVKKTRILSTTKYFEAGQAEESLKQIAHPYATSSDPTIYPGINQYSRPIEDLSTYLVIFDSQFSTPFVCITAAAEFESQCFSFPTPNDLSMTIIPRVAKYFDSMSSRTQEIGSLAAKLICQGGVSSHREVIEKFLEAWTNDKHPKRQDEIREAFGRVIYTWQEVKNRVESDRWFREIESMEFWPQT